tara:strand:+ start:423 stop:830 length:408 start_codon:yes stop_codon:yes gene_type:complete
MKIRNSLFENKQYFETIGKIHSSDELSVMDAYRINRLVKKMNELNEEYTELKNKLITQYGTPGEKEGQFAVEGDSREEFLKEFNELLNIEHDLETELLSWPQKIKDGFSAADLNILEMFFNLDEMVEPKEETDNQ